MTSPSQNTVIMLIVFVIGGIINYAFNISMGWLLSPAQFGVLGVSISFLLILSLFISSAFPLTVTKFLSESEEQSIDNKHRVFKSSLAGNISIAVIVSTLFYLTYLSGILSLEPAYHALVIVIVFAVFVSSLVLVYQSILQGFFRFKAFGIVGIIGVILKLAVAVLLVFIGFGAFGAMLGILAGSCVTLILLVLFTRDFRFWKTSGWAGANVYFFAFPMFFGMLSMTLLMNIDLLGVKFFTVSDTLAGYYRASIILAQLPVFIVGAMMAALFPSISQHRSTHGTAYVAKALKFSIMFILPVGLSLVLMPASWITLIFPQTYLAGAHALAIVSIGMCFFVLINVFAMSFQAVGRPKVPAVVSMLAVAIDMLALYILVPRYGIVGAAYSTTIACFAGLVLLAGVYGITYSFNLKPADVVKTFAAFAVFAFFLYMFPHSSRLLTLVDFGLGGIIYLVILTLLKLLSVEDASIILSGFMIGRLEIYQEKVLAVVKALNRVF